MGGKRDQKLRRKAEARRQAHNRGRKPYVDICSMPALRAHDRLLQTFFAGMQYSRSSTIPEDELVSRLSYLRGIKHAVEVLKEEMKRDGTTASPVAGVHEAE